MRDFKNHRNYSFYKFHLFYITIHILFLETRYSVYFSEIIINLTKYKYSDLLHNMICKQSTTKNLHGVFTDIKKKDWRNEAKNKFNEKLWK